MASLFKLNKRWSIQFVAKDGRRPTIRLGVVPEKTAQAIRTHVERLVNATIDRQPVTKDTAEWVAECGDKIYDKLASAGLVAPRERPEAVKLAAFLDSYIKGRTDLKERSKANLTQARNGLVKHFGADRDIRTITRGEAGDWHRGIKAKLSKATVAGHVKRARMFFADAIARKLITENPITGIKAGSMANPARFVYVPVADVESIIEHCPDAEWRLIFALARFNGLRIPSETNALKWSDIDWQNERMTVRASKTEHHAGGGVRVVPIFPKTMPHLRDVFELAGDGAKNVIALHRGENLRTRAEKIIGRAGLVPWGKLFQNMRSSCETDLTSTFPIHVVCAWIGNSEAVARKHYLQVHDEHFLAATGKSAAQSDAEGPGNGRKHMPSERQNPAFQRGSGENQYPQGVSNYPPKIAEFLGVPQKALHQAMRRLKNANPTAYHAELRRVRQEYANAGGKVRPRRPRPTPPTRRKGGPMNIILKAARYADAAHWGQTRKYTGTPYILHPMRVAGRVTLLPDATETMVAAAWLHDVVEDTGIKDQAILDTFGMPVADLVVQLTNPSKQYPNLPRWERKAMDREYLSCVPVAAKQIKLCDRIDNIREMSLAPRDFIVRYVEETRLLATVLDSPTTESLVAELLKACADLIDFLPQPAPTAKEANRHA